MKGNMKFDKNAVISVKSNEMVYFTVYIVGKSE